MKSMLARIARLLGTNENGAERYCDSVRSAYGGLNPSLEEIAGWLKRCPELKAYPYELAQGIKTTIHHPARCEHGKYVCPICTPEKYSRRNGDWSSD
jgi:hypothetical protein